MPSTVPDRSHQADVVPRLLQGHYGLWWSPGCGKTAPLAVAGREAGGPQLWLTTNATLARQTAREIIRFRGDSPRVQVLVSGRDKLDPKADVTVVGIDLAKSLPVWRQLFAASWTSLVIDEAHGLASTTTRRTQAVYGATPLAQGALYRRAGRVWPSTGTPMVNSPSDLWPHISRLWPQVATPTKAAWEAQYCVLAPNPFVPGTSRVVGGRNLEELGRRLAPYSSRISLAEVQPHMPSLSTTTLPVEISPEIRARLDALFAATDPALLAALRDALDQMAEERDSDAAADRALGALYQPLASLRRLLALAKALPVAEQALAELEAGADRIVVFGLHTEALRLVADRLSEAPYNARLLIGDTTSVQRDAAIAAFADGRCRVLVCNIMVGGVGLNLQMCRRLIFTEAAWTPASNSQAIARCHRAGQSRPVHASFAVVEGTIDQAVLDVLARKAGMIATFQQELSA